MSTTTAPSGSTRHRISSVHVTSAWRAEYVRRLAGSAKSMATGSAHQRLAEVHVGHPGDRQALGAAGLDVAVPAVEAGRLGREGRQHHLLAAAGDGLRLGGRQEPAAQAGAPGVLADPEHADAGTGAPGP